MSEDRQHYLAAPLWWILFGRRYLKALRFAAIRITINLLAPSVRSREPRPELFNKPNAVAIANERWRSKSSRAPVRCLSIRDVKVFRHTMKLVSPFAIVLLICAIALALPLTSVQDRLRGGLANLQTPVPLSSIGGSSTPLIYGWGGILAVGAVHFGFANMPSKVFPGEQASNTEVTFAEMKARGYNGARVAIIDPGNQPDSGVYNSSAWGRTLALAQHYGLYVIGDDHEYNVSSSWLPFWQTVLRDTPQSRYPNVLWEAQNEPHDANLANDFQAFINLDRSMGDTRWIVLACNDSCTPTGTSDLSLFPIVNDTINHIFYDFHEYYFYPEHSTTWSISDAVTFADEKWAGVQHVIGTLHRPFLGTEWGAETGCYNCANQTVPGSAGYAPETLAYLTEIVKLSQQAGIGYTIWNAGDWNDPPAGVTGALDTFGQFLPLPGTTPLRGPLVGDVNGDCAVNIRDLVQVAAAYGSTPTSLNWNPLADINGDGKISLLDLVMVGIHFGETC